MRRSPRTTLLALPFVALALAAAGCGGSEVDADEVPGAPPALTVPTEGELGAGTDADADAEANPDASADESTEDPAESGAATDPDAAAAPETTEPVDPSGGTTAPETAAPDEGAADPAQPPADSPPEQFESFCEQNAGAC